MTMPLVSVVVPAYNAGQYIRECINSIVLQDYRPIEIVIVDDCSTDDTLSNVAMMKQSVENDPQVTLKLYHMMRNMGAAHALDFGCRHSVGKYIAWLSADDMFINPLKTSIQMGELDVSRSDWSYCDQFIAGTTIQTSGVISPTYLPKFKWFDRFFERFNLLRFFCLFWRNPIQGSSFMITRDAYEKYGGFDPEMRNADADRDFWFRLSVSGATLKVIHGIPPPVFYRIHTSQLSNDTSTMQSGYRQANHAAWKLFLHNYTGGLL
jgi:glycosyltransferase involved in cell wall biosynthesis